MRIPLTAQMRRALARYRAARAALGAVGPATALAVPGTERRAKKIGSGGEEAVAAAYRSRSGTDEESAMHGTAGSDGVNDHAAAPCDSDDAS